MQARFKLSSQARLDIKKILQYSLSEFGEYQVLKYKTGLEDSLHLLADNPDAGRPCDEIKISLQRHEHGRHIIFYRKRKADVFIIRIIDERMDPVRRI